MLSPRPEERGTAQELAEAMERGVAHAPLSADEPLFGARAWGTLQARPVKARRWLPWLAAAMTLGLWPENPGSVHTVEQASAAHRAPDTAKRKEDSVSLGDDKLSSSENVAKAPSKKPIALELPKQPFPDQRKPDAKGRCPDVQIPINGGCWAKVPLKVDECIGHVFVYEGGCYVPVHEPVRKPTSEPQPR